MSNAQTVNISTKSVLKILAIILALMFLYAVREVAVVVFVALVLAAAIDPSITALERKGIPRPFGIAIIFIGILALLSLIVALFVPVVIDQLEQFTSAFPDLFRKGFKLFESVQDNASLNSIQKGLDSLTSSLSQVTQGFFTGLVGFFGGLVAVISILVLTFYMTLEEKGMKRIAVDISPVRYRPYLTQLFHRVEDRLGRWLRGQLLLGLIIAGMTLVGLLILGVDYPVVLALFAGLTEMIPIIGPFIGAIPAVIVGVSQAPVMGLWVALMYLIIQQLENHLIVPRVMSKASGLNPVIVIIAILVGGKLFSITGVILAVPTMIIITTFLEDFLEEKKASDLKLETSDQP